MLFTTFTFKVLPLPIYKSTISFENLIDGRVLRAPEVLEGGIKLENALPVAGFLARSDDSKHGEHKDGYTSYGKLRVKPGSIDAVIAAIKDETALLLSSEPELLSFFALQSLDEVDAVIIWSRFASQAAFDECRQKGRGYAKSLEKIESLGEMETEGMTGYSVVGGYLSNEKR
jgi:quinol monooxygenase YgiN